MKLEKIVALLVSDRLEKILEGILFLSLCIAVIIKISSGSWDVLILVLLAAIVSPFVKVPEAIKRLIICLGIIYILLMGII